MAEKAKYWSTIMYPENMVDDWQSKIDNLLQVPFCYIVHDKDLDNDDDARKVHVHLMIAFSNTTTRKHAQTVFNRLSKEGYCAFSTWEQIFNIRHMYDYFIHATNKAIKDGKYQYDVSDRVTGNNFDIGMFEQVSTLDKNNVCKSLCDIILRERFTNFIDFYEFIMFQIDSDALIFECLKCYSGLFERLIKGNYNKYSNNFDVSLFSTTSEKSVTKDE